MGTHPIFESDFDCLTEIKMELTAKISHTINAHTDRCWSVDWSPNGQLLGSAGGDAKGRVWARQNEQQAEHCVATIDETRTVRRLKFAPCGRKLATCSFNGKVQIYEVEESEWEAICELEGHESEVKSISWSADGLLLATCGRDKAVWIWESWEDGAEYECQAVLTAHSADVKDVQFHPFDPILISASYDMTVKVYKEIDGEWDCIQTLVGHTDTVWACCWSPDGKRIVSVGADNCMRVWRHNGTNFELESNVQGEHGRSIYTVSWSDKGILTGAGDNHVRLFTEQADKTWLRVSSLELNADINSVSWCQQNTDKAAAATDDGDVLVLAIK